ncbi:ATP-dependent nuclease [Shewanella baltica]|uniref:ATP-dependent nuclease n=1 Tax=Shewanella baltica TaxID=62322 RepID=UPI00217EA3BC|nr:ATP-binding protein [Shewanella baltica]MCS6173722.1 ATP-binding protein [Shewanella baltica]
MKIDKLEIKNFRTLENVILTFGGYFASISGKNNAGKTSVIRCIRSLFKGQEREFSIFDEEDSISYTTAKTQWASCSAVIEFGYFLNASKDADPGLYSFVKKIAEIDNLPDHFNLEVKVRIKEKEEKEISIVINEKILEKYETGEIYQRLSSSNIIFLHNSTGGGNKIYYPSGARSFHEMMLSKDEKEDLKREQERIKKKVKKFASEHRGGLSGLLGKLEDKYEVELTVFDGLFRNSIPLGINLKDKGLEVALDDWGAGTQNRTQIMMSILSASRVKQQSNDENRITPIIIIEEPESFLHPSAQAEFGRVIRGLARELEIQIIITTHSPYMLCQEHPESNVLLDRKLFRNRLKETVVVDVSSNKWMEPFSDILGLNHEAVEPWRDVVKASRDNAVLVEGTIDKEYLEHISSLGIKGFTIPEGVEVIAYGGKDALKNSIMLKFVIEKFNRVYITYDLDAKNELHKIMMQLSLEVDNDHMAVGLNEEGKDCIEGLLPQNVLSNVYGSNTNIVMKLTSTDANARKSAKNELKAKLLEEFKKNRSVASADLKGFKTLFANINKAFNS